MTGTLVKPNGTANHAADLCNVKYVTAGYRAANVHSQCRNTLDVSQVCEVILYVTVVVV